MQGANPCRVYIKPRTPLNNVEQAGSFYKGPFSDVREPILRVNQKKNKSLTNGIVEVYWFYNYELY
ncbi:hypothetical protein ATT32_08460 [Listeria monocytogenes]|uniref:Uncharacterized protein n=1 Tax=Listeria monocytogenes TaxID=1639 RepID=A0AAN2WLS2_LISMN|nr:hypothetical protein [Listeria monocytogenes]EAC2927789.1 hypothetical protein [Listeria monocytogenes]EAC2933899.1 hypothetical protein [Listeria monocytogenes]EAC3540327.1 hypothetical protein [Listeria monocytogenes]EAC3544991.1 hypothetical protein [Listeria monocytogenes]